MKLTHEQVELIRGHIRQSGIQLQSLEDDVLDHVCCVLENENDLNVNFQKRLLDAINDLAPEGLHKLEKETVFLLNSKKLIYMKKLMYLVGLGSSIALAMGI